MVTDAFEECQCAHELCYSLRPSGCPAFGGPHARLVYTPSFPQLWKNLWKIARNASIRCSSGRNDAFWDSQGAISAENRAVLTRGIS